MWNNTYLLSYKQFKFELNETIQRYSKTIRNSIRNIKVLIFINQNYYVAIYLNAD